MKTSQELAREGDFIGSFEAFLLQKNKNTCMACWGFGKLKFKGNFMTYPVECPKCKGSGINREEQP